MTCKHCCGADQLFDLKGAQKEMKKFKRKGSGAATKKLVRNLFRNDIKGKSLLDIGGGIGAIQWAFLARGGKKTTDVDASLNYLNVAESYAIDNDLMEKSSFFHGDFVDQPDDIEMADFVTLDKVICCYPDYQSLLKNALEKCENTIGVVYPFGGPVSRLFTVFEHAYFWIKKIEFRTYIHPPQKVEKFILDHGFEIVTKTSSFPWHVQIYQRATSDH